MKFWSENKIEFWIRITLLMINIVLTFVFRGNHFVLGYTYGVNLVIILESLGLIITRNHNKKVILKPFKQLSKELDKAFKDLKEK